MTVQYRTLVGLSISILFAVGFAGCGESDSATVTGRVTLDGIPLDRGRITFVGLGEDASGGVGGTIHEDGTYSIQIGRSGKVLAGEYAVKVVVVGPSIPDPEGGPPITGELLTPQHYARTATSGLRYNIRTGENTIDVALSSEASGPASDETVAPTVNDEAPEEKPAETNDDAAADTAADAAEEQGGDSGRPPL